VAREGRRELAAAGAAREPPTDEASKFVPIANREDLALLKTLSPATTLPGSAVKLPILTIQSHSEGRRGDA
jgi:hypothetical protein